MPSPLEQHCVAHHTAINQIQNCTRERREPALRLVTGTCIMGQFLEDGHLLFSLDTYLPIKQKARRLYILNEKQSRNIQKQASTTGGQPPLQHNPAMWPRLKNDDTDTRNLFPRNAPMASEAKNLKKNEHKVFIQHRAAVSEKSQNFQRKLNLAVINMIKQLHSSNVTNTFLS